MNLPSDFLQMMEKQIGEKETALLNDAISTQSPTSIRTNPWKVCNDVTGTEPATESALNMEFTPVAWCKNGRILKDRPSFTFDPLFHAGIYYVQESSSMYIEQLIRQYISQPVVALDMCAAPGGKSTLALANLPEGSLLIANEVNHKRCNILAENIIKWGNPNCIVTSNYADAFAEAGPFFDLIICDAPCSGEGMFRKDEDSITEWSLDNVEQCWKRQREIVGNLWRCLKPGGILIYSTCTYNHFEDEDVIQWMQDELGAEKLPLHDDKEWQITNGHFFPHKTPGEGFFVCPMRKATDNDDEDECLVTGSQGRSNKKGKSDKGLTTVKAGSPLDKELRNMLKDASRFSILEDNGKYTAFPSQYTYVLQWAKRNLKVVHAGIDLASTKGKNLQPEHDIALSTELNRGYFAEAELTREQAIAYLRTEAVVVNAPKGVVLLTYKDIPLGFGKNIGNRVNNLYPSEWKIRKNY